MGTSKKLIGAHVSASGGVFNAPKNAYEIGAKAFALFVKNQRQWVAKPLDEETINKFKSEMKRYGYTPEQVLPHAGYLINLGNPEIEKREKSINAFIDEINRCKSLGLIYNNIHPGSHLKAMSEEECLDLISESINIVLDKTKDSGVTIVLENTAGQGSNLGYKFEHLAHIINKVNDKSRIGVCLDTCHTLAAGYDLLTEDGYNNTFDDFERIVGFEYLKGIHLNDSKFGVGTKKDRHDSIGKGVMGIDFFKKFINDERFNDIPITLETIDDSLWKEEIELLYSFDGKEVILPEKIVEEPKKVSKVKEKIDSNLNDDEKLKEYFENVSDKRKETILKLRELCKTILKDFEENFSYDMPTYSKNSRALIAFKEQKNYISFYVLDEILEKYKDNFKKSNIGKNCVRFTERTIDLTVLNMILEDINNLK